MSYTASGIVRTARSLADLQNTKNVTYQDQLDAINEAWRDLYSRYTESDGEYFVSEYDFTLTPAMLDPTGLGGTDYLVPLPTDFYKIRYLDYSMGGVWRPVDRFAIAQRDGFFGKPRYQIKNGNLWLKVPAGIASGFRMAYYTPPVPVTMPDDMKTYGANIPAYNKPLALWPTFASTGNTLLYVYNGLTIYAESQDNATVTSLYTAAGAMTWLTYYKGYVYWIQGANILRAPTDLTTSPLVPTTIISTANVVCLSIQNDKLYFSTGANTKIANLDGTSPSNVFTGQAYDYCLIQTSLVCYLTALPGNLVINGVVVLSNIQHVESDGAYLYVSDTSYNLSRLTISPAGAITATTLLYSGVTLISEPNGGFLAVILAADSSLAALSVVPDTSFAYPINEVSEVMQYRCALNFARKSMDKERIAYLEQRLNDPENGLWARFWAVNKRDEYQFVRVNDDYGNSGMPGNW